VITQCLGYWAQRIVVIAFVVDYSVVAAVDWLHEQLV